MTIWQDIGARLRAARVEQGRSAVAIATQLGVSRSYLHHVEAGRKPLSVEQLQRIAAAYGLASVEIPS